MTVKIPMPALSPTMTEGTLTKWLIKVGDQVKAGDVLAEIETDKATMEVEAVDEGKVAKLIVEEGTSNIPVNSTIAILDGDDKDQNEGDQDQTKDTVGKIKKKEILDNNVVKKSSFEKKLGKKIIASPYAKSLAKKDKLTLDNIIGSGPGGRVIKRDLKNQKTSQPSIKTSQENISAPSSMRKIIAEYCKDSELVIRQVSLKNRNPDNQPDTELCLVKLIFLKLILPFTSGYPRSALTIGCHSSSG